MPARMLDRWPHIMKHDTSSWKGWRCCHSPQHLFLIELHTIGNVKPRASGHHQDASAVEHQLEAADRDAFSLVLLHL